MDADDQVSYIIDMIMIMIMIIIIIIIIIIIHFDFRGCTVKYFMAGISTYKFSKSA